MTSTFITLTEDVRSRNFWIAVIGEFLATAILIFVGCGSVIVHFEDELSSSSDIVRASLTFGLTITVIIASFGPAADCHLNPAVSIGLMFGGRTSLVRTFLYVISQVMGAIVGISALYHLVPTEHRFNLGLTELAPNLSPAQGFFTEFVATFILMLIISACIDDTRSEFRTFQSANPLIIGFTIVFLGVSCPGASLNPARSYAPALLNWRWNHHWIYWVGPISGGVLGSLAYRYLINPEAAVSRADDHNKQDDITRATVVMAPGSYHFENNFSRLAVPNYSRCSSASSQISDVSDSSSRAVRIPNVASVTEHCDVSDNDL